MSHTALLVIDAQRAFENETDWDSPATAAWLARQNALIAHAEDSGWPIARILHHSRKWFDPTADGVQPLPGLQLADTTPSFIKHAHNALTAEGLGQWLQQHRIAHLVISGIRTDQCCETTARSARDDGFEVDFVIDATLSFAITADNGEKITAEQIYTHTAAVLNRRFAAVQTVDSLKATTASPAINRYCPRSGKPVAADSVVDYQDHRVGFCNTGCSTDFDSDPVLRPADRRYFDRLIGLRQGTV